MPSVRDLRDRIRSLKNTQQITKAMKQVAAAKIRRAEEARKRARPYADALAEMLADLMAGFVRRSPFMKPGNESAPAGIVLMSADKGLAGAFNSNVIHAAESFARGRSGVRYYTVGLKRVTPCDGWAFQSIQPGRSARQRLSRRARSPIA